MLFRDLDEKLKEFFTEDEEHDFNKVLKRYGKFDFEKVFDKEAYPDPPERVFSPWTEDEFGHWYQGERDKIP